MSRFSDNTRVKCEECDWRGTVAEAHHGYLTSALDPEEASPMDFCPRCGSENLWPEQENKEPALI